MRKCIFVIATMFILISSVAFGQKEASLTCYYYDSETETPGIEISAIDSNINCLKITGAVSEKILDDIFSKVIMKEKIIKIEISNYAYKTFPSSIKEFKNVKSFSVISSPQISYRKLFNQLQHLTNLTTLELDDNEKAVIPSNIKLFKNLKVLSITNYDLVDANKLFKNISKLPSLENLTLASIGKLILDINSPFPKGLKTLDMSDNWLSYLPKNISKSSELQSLDISENNFLNTEINAQLIEKLPLTSLAITCADRRDSLMIVKTFSGIDLQVSLYHDFSRKNVYRNNLKKEETIPAISNFYNKTLKPPIGNPEIIRKKYTIENQKSNTLYYPAGTVIKIPEEAFVDTLGNPVKGDVTIYYREYKDILDIFANGVPMNYDSAGQKQAFRTAGMFEIYALKDNKQVYLSPGKTISFDFATADTSYGNNLYQLNEKTGNWDFKKPLNNNFKIKLKDYSYAYRLYASLNNIRFDTTLFEARYNDSLYARTKKIPLEYFKGKKRLLDPYFKLKRVYNYDKNKDIKKMPNFIMDGATLRELNAYNGFVWVYSGPLSKKEFGKKYISRKKWTDMRINYVHADNLFSIELKSPHEVVQFQAFPIKSNYTSATEEYNKTYLKLDNRYTKILTKIQVRFDKNITKKIARNRKKMWEKINRNMSPEEKAMSRDEWIAYARKRISIEKDSLNKIHNSFAAVTRGFEINGFGIWNCDQIARLNNPISLIAHFKDAFDNKIIASTVNVIDGKTKTILSYNMTLNEANIALDPNSETALFLIGTNGSVAVVDKTSVKNAISEQTTNGNYTFTTYEIDPKSMSSSELRKLLGFDY